MGCMKIMNNAHRPLYIGAIFFFFCLILLIPNIYLQSKTVIANPKFIIYEGTVSKHKQTVKIKNGKKTIAKISLDEPTIVAVADEPLKWGYFQFPNIYRMVDGALLVTWQMRADSYKAYGQRNVGKNKRMSKDNGKTWIDYDGRYEREQYIFAVKDGEEYLSISSPAPNDITKFHNFPNAIDEIYHYGIKYQFYNDSDLPDNVGGIYVRRWTNRKVPASEVKILHAKFKDDGLCRYSTDNQISTLWDGDIKQLNNGDVVGCTYRGFYCNERGKILPSGISFYKWNEDELSWHILGKIPFEPDLKADPTGLQRKVWGFTEPTFVELENGTLVCVVRSSEEEKLTPMYRSVSMDHGKTWSKPIAFTPNGVSPHFLKLRNGTIVLSSGRPGVQLRFNFDGTAENWTEPIDMLPFIKQDGSYEREVSCGYTGLLPIDDESFYLVYSDFLQKDSKGNVRKSIKIRKIIVRNYTKKYNIL